MKFFSVLMFLVSCTAMQKTGTTPESDLNVSNSGQIAPARENFKHVVSPSGTYILYYKKKENANSPVIMLEYFVISKKTGKTIKAKETLAAEKIYWKDNNSIAIIPYEDAMKHQELGEEPENREIIIKIK